MHRTLLILGAALALGLTTACSSDAPAPSAGTRAAAAPRRAPTPSTHGAYAFAEKDTPYASVLAEARRRNQPALLFFWTSW